MPIVTYATIIKGIINDKKVLKIEDKVTTTRLNHSGINDPNKIPMIIARINFGINPILNLFFSMCNSSNHVKHSSYFLVDFTFVFTLT